LFYISKETELTTELLNKMVNRFILNEQPKLKKYKDYYDGKHAILRKVYADVTKPCNRVVTNFCKVITDEYAGYIAGKPVTYTSNDDIDDVQEVINYNDDESQNIQWLTNTLVHGIGYELQWIDKDAQVRYSQVNPLNAFAVYSNDLEKELLYFIRWYDADAFDEQEIYFLEVYDNARKITYKARGLGGSLEFISEEIHYFKDVPVSVFNLNDNNESIFNQAISLNDAYNEVQSSELDDYQAFVDAYLLFSGAGDIDEEDVKNLEKGKQKRTIVLPEGVDASWLTKNTSDVQVENILLNIRKNLFKVTAAPDMSDETFMAQSGEAIKYKLVGFENMASGIVTRFTKAIQRRIELICNILNLKASDAVWRDIQISFVRNLPQNITEVIGLVNSLQGLVSHETLLSQIPFIDDVQKELEAVQAEKEANMAMFSFGFTEEEDEVNEEQE
jgi:SPP1 family phage portal protein